MRSFKSFAATKKPQLLRSPARSSFVLTGQQHVLREGLPVEGVGAAVEQVAHDDRAVHDLAAGQQHRVGHERVHEGVLELVGRVREPVVRLLVAEQDGVGAVGQRPELVDLIWRLDQRPLQPDEGVVEQGLSKRALKEKKTVTLPLKHAVC